MKLRNLPVLRRQLLLVSRAHTVPFVHDRTDISGNQAGFLEIAIYHHGVVFLYHRSTPGAHYLG